MKILLIVDSYLPSPKSAAKLFHDLAAELVQRGHSPTVLTVSHEAKSDVEETFEEGIRIIRVRMAELKTKSRVVRAWREARLSLTVWFRAKRLLRKSKFDLIAFYSPSIFWGPLIIRLKWLYGCPAYLYLRDIIPKWLVDIKLMKKGPVYLFFRLAELLEYFAADIIAVQSSGDLEYFDSYPAGIRGKLDVVYNWAARDEGVVAPRDLRGEQGLNGKTIFFFGGTFGKAQDMDAIVRLAISLRNEHSIFFLLAGYGTETDRINDWVTREGLDNFRIIPPLSQRDYLSVVAEIDVGMIFLAGDLTTHNVPGKTLSYSYFAKPILASVNPGGELTLLLNRYEAGLVADAGQDDLLKANVLALAGSSELRNRMGANSRKMLEEKFSIDSAVEKLLETPSRLSRRAT